MPVEHEDGEFEESNEVKLAKDQAAAEALRVAGAWQAVVASPEGRAVLWDIMGRLGLMASPLRPGMSDMTFAAIGKSDGARELYAKVAEYPAYLKAMHQENGL